MEKESQKNKKGKMLTVAKKCATVMLVPMIAASSLAGLTGCGSTPIPEDIKQLYSAIDNIPQSIIDSDEYYNALDAAEKLYNALSPANRAKVNSAKLASLHAARLRWTDFDRSTARTIAIAHVNTLIELIPELVYVVCDDSCRDECRAEQIDIQKEFKKLLEEAVEAFDALERWIYDEEDAVDIRDYLDVSKKQLLLDAIDALDVFIQELEWAIDVDIVIDLIELIPDLSLEQLNETNVVDFGAAINAARAVYDNLANDSLRGRITNRSTLFSAEINLSEYLYKKSEDDAVAHVIDLINQIPVSLIYGVNSSEDQDTFARKLLAAKSAFEAIVHFNNGKNIVNLQSRITNSARLTTAQDELNAFNIAAQNTLDVNAVIELIDEIPASLIYGVNSMEDKTVFANKLSIAKIAFENLESDTLRDRVTNSTRLGEAQNELDVFNAAVQDTVNVNNVINLIDEIPTLVYMIGQDQVAERAIFEGKLYAAKTAFENLANDTLRSRVTNSARLGEAQSELDAFDIEAQYTIDVEGVIGLISQIPESLVYGVNSTTEKDEFASKLLTAKTAFENLANDTLRSRVTNSARLGEAQSEIDTYNQEEVYALAVNNVIGLIDEIPSLVYVIGQDQTQEKETFQNKLNIAKTAFENLESDTLRSRVTNSARLSSAQSELDEFNVQVQNTIEVNNVISQINAIPTLIFKAGEDQTNERTVFVLALSNAWQAYNSLADDTLRDRVTNSVRLSSAQSELTAFDEAAPRYLAVITTIYLIDTVHAASLNLRAERTNFANALNAAQTAYEGLANFNESGNNYQSDVTNTSDLVNAHSKLNQFDNIDVPAADVIVTTVDSIPALNAINADNYEQINIDFVIPAREAFNALTPAQIVLVNEVADLAQLEQTILDAEQAVVLASIPQLTVSLNGATISWNEITAADSYDVSYTVISLDDDIVETKAVANIDDTTFEIADQGFVYNIIVKANMKENFEFINRTSVIADVNLVSTMSLAAAMQEVATNNPTGADNNYLMAFLVNNALKELEQEENLHIRSRGISFGNAGSGETVNGSEGSSVRLSLAVGGDTIIKRDPNNGFAVMEACSDKFAWRSWTTAGLGASGGASLAGSEATRANRAYFNADLGVVYNQYIHGSGSVSSLGSLSNHYAHTEIFSGSLSTSDRGTTIDWTNNNTLQPRWDDVRTQNNRRQIIAQNVWMENVGVAPYDWFPAIVTNSTLIGSHGEGKNVRIRRGTSDTNFQEEVKLRQRISIDEIDNTFSFSSFKNPVSALELNSKEQVRMGGLISHHTESTSAYAYANYKFDANLNLIGFRLYSKTFAVNPAGKSHTSEVIDFDIIKGIEAENAVENMWRADEPVWSQPSADGQPPVGLPAAITRMPVLWWDGGGTTYSTNAACVAEGSLITMADGTTKKVENVKEGDRALVWNFYEGKFDVATVIALASTKNIEATVIEMKFVDGYVLKLVNDHCLYNYTKNAYINISKKNAKQFIGDTFVCHSKDAKTIGEVKLIDVKISTQKINMYTPVTYKHMDVFANGILTSPGEVHNSVKNIFKVNTKTLSYDEKNYDELVKKYGLLTWKEFRKHCDLGTEELFDALNAKYFSIRLGRGDLTWKDVNSIVATILSFL